MYADRIRTLALSFPQTHEDRPWGFPRLQGRADRLTREEREIAELLKSC